MSQVLDLRKKSKREIIAKEVQKEAMTRGSISPAKTTELKPSPPPNKNKQAEISWEAPSFYFNPQKKYLILLIIALATGGAAMLFWNRDTLTAIFLLLSSLVLILYSNKRPETSKININQTGIEIGEILYYYRDLKSFWIHYDPGNIKELSLESKKWFLPHVKISIENKSPLEIRSLLVNFLPEREHEHSLVDLLARKIGL